MNILITGASKGIGRELALKFSESADNKVLAIARSGKLLKSLSKDALNNNIVYMEADINLMVKKPEKLLKDLKGEFDELNILINNAGYLIPGAFRDMTSEEDEAIISTNFTAPMQLIRALLPIIPAGGHIVNISSMSAYPGSSKYPGLAVYGAAKGALSALTESLAAEFGSSGPSINCLSPGAVQTEMLSSAFPGFRAPLSPQEMASFICWFAEHGSKYFNGQNLPVTLGNPE